MKTYLFLSSLFFSLFVSKTLAWVTYEGDCKEIDKIYQQRECLEQNCIEECITNERGEVISLKINDFRLNESEIKKILSYETINTLYYEAYQPFSPVKYVKKDEVFPKAILELPNLKELTFNYRYIFNKHRQKSIYYFDLEKGLLNKLKNLNKLELIRVNLSKDNIDEISSLTNVNELILEDCPKNGFGYEFLKKLNWLTSLKIIKNEEETFNATKYLKYLKSLRKLSLTVEAFTQKDIDEIAKSKYLNELELINNHLEDSLDLQPLSNLTRLLELNLDSKYSDAIFSNVPFKSFKKLKSLKLIGYDLNQESINEISELRKIENLYLGDCVITGDFSPIKNLKKLYNLHIDNEFEETENYNQILLDISSFTKLKKLELAGVVSTLPKEMANLKKLESLDLKSNEITSLPDIFGNFKYLQYLNLSFNAITELPESIGKLKNLKKLLINDTKLKTIPESIGNLKNLEYIDGGFSSIETIPKSLGNLKNLKYLNLRDNNIESIPSSLGKLKNLEYLNLNHNNISSEIPESLNDLPKLKFVEFVDNENIKGKTLTNPSLEYCHYVYYYGRENDDICITKSMDCLGEDDVDLKLCDEINTSR